jgi:hypothetical protein
MGTEPLSRHLGRCLQLVSAAFKEQDDEKARELIEQSSEAFIDDVKARWKKRLRVAETFLDAAESTLDAAEAAKASGDQAESEKKMRLFELYLQMGKSIQQGQIAPPS